MSMQTLLRFYSRSWTYKLGSTKVAHQFFLLIAYAWTYTLFYPENTLIFSYVFIWFYEKMNCYILGLFNTHLTLHDFYLKRLYTIFSMCRSRVLVWCGVPSNVILFFYVFYDLTYRGHVKWTVYWLLLNFYE